MCDIILMFVTTRLDNAGSEVDLVSLIAKDYLKETFIFDFVGCFPGLIFLEQEPKIYFLKLLRFIQMTRTLEQVDSIVTKLKHRFLQNMLTIDNTFKLVKLLCVLVMLFHLFACIWIYIGDTEGGWRREEGLTWSLEDQRYIYVTSMYFVCTTATTIGYGD
jgi:hypothetical protein